MWHNITGVGNIFCLIKNPAIFGVLSPHILSDFKLDQKLPIDSHYSSFAFNILLYYLFWLVHFIRLDFKLGQKWLICSHFIAQKTYFAF